MVERQVSKETEKIMKADSTNVYVITHYNKHYFMVYKKDYPLSDEMIQAINHSTQIKFRYYAGLSMITVPIKK